MWSARYLLFLRQTGSRHIILEVCEFQFWQCRDSICHTFLRILAVLRLHLIDPSSIEHNSACLFNLVTWFRYCLGQNLLFFSYLPCLHRCSGIVWYWHASIYNALYRWSVCYNCESYYNVLKCISVYGIWLSCTVPQIIMCVRCSTVHGRIDQVHQLLELNQESTGVARYNGMDKWSAQIASLHEAIINRVT